jgi:hypothetical protein
MSFRASQLSPQGTNAKNLRVVIQNPPSDPPEHRDMQFWRSWFEFESDDPDEKGSRSKLNWNMLLGVVVVVGISASFWTGVGLLIARALR